jgi:membrane-associated PAP2 superfamily phosphatase
MKFLMQSWRLYWRVLLPIMLAPLIVLFFETTSVDKSLIALYYDAESHGFPLRDTPFMQHVMHTGLKMAVVVIGIAVFIAFLLTFVKPQWRPYRRRLLWLSVGMAGGALLVSVLKQNSALHCPWDLVEYGGITPFHGLLDRLPSGVARGRCFPGGHASGGFALMAFYFAWRDTDAKLARWFLAIALVAGMVMGWTQMMRGAHFLSHNIWSAWVVWMYLAVLYHVVPPRVENGPQRSLR